MPDLASLADEAVRPLAEQAGAAARTRKRTRATLETWRRYLARAGGRSLAELADLAGVDPMTVSRARARVERVDQARGGDDLPRRGR